MTTMDYRDRIVDRLIEERSSIQSRFNPAIRRENPTPSPSSPCEITPQQTANLREE